jgi:hypothetical protein
MFQRYKYELTLQNINLVEKECTLNEKIVFDTAKNEANNEKEVENKIYFSPFSNESRENLTGLSYFSGEKLSHSAINSRWMSQNSLNDDAANCFKTNESISNRLYYRELFSSQNAKFTVASQEQKAQFVGFNLSELINLFSTPICFSIERGKSCRNRCDCRRMFEIGMQIYDKGGVQSFTQIDCYIVGSVCEQATDPLTNVVIKFDR